MTLAQKYDGRVDCQLHIRTTNCTTVQNCLCTGWTLWYRLKGAVCVSVCKIASTAPAVEICGVIGRTRCQTVTDIVTHFYQYKMYWSKYLPYWHVDVFKTSGKLTRRNYELAKKKKCQREIQCFTCDSHIYTGRSS